MRTSVGSLFHALASFALATFLAPVPAVAQDAAPPSVAEVDPDALLDEAFELLVTDVEEAQSAFIAAARLLPPERATEVVQLANLLFRLPPEPGRVLAAAELAARQGGGASAAQALAAADSFPDPTRAVLLAHAARMADRADRAELAASFRERLLEELAEQPEASEAALELARHLALRPEGVARAVEVLEELITSRPNAVVTPTARVELERLRRGGS